jgi:hypothetical protein
VNAPLRLTGPVDIISTLPYQLGFQPTRCVIVVCITRDNRLGLIQRIDLPQEAEIPAATASLGSSLANEAPRAALLLGYEDTQGESLPMLDSVSGLVSELGIRITDTIVVRDGRYFSADCTDLECCPMEGTPLPESPAIAAEYVARGVAPLADREAMLRSIEASPRAMEVGARIAEVLERQFEEIREARSSGREEEATHQLYTDASLAWGRILTGSEDLRYDDVAAATLVLSDVAYRDALLAYMTPGMLTDDMIDADTRGYMALLPAATWLDGGAGTVQHRLVTMCSLLPDEVAALPLVVLANFTWWRGDGATASAALGRALRCDPDLRLAQLLSAMVQLAIRPVRATA